MTANTKPDHPRSRRALLAGVLGGLGAWAASTVARVDPTAAAAGDPIRMGRLNRAYGTSTELQTSSSKPAFWAKQLAGGTALRAESGSGRAVMATAGGHGTAVWAYSPNDHAVFANSGSGVAVEATSQVGTGVLANGADFGVYAHATHIGLFASGSERAAKLQGDLEVQGFEDLWWLVNEPDAPEFTSVARFFARPNGAGKTQLCVKFHTGAVQVIATEP